MKQTNRTILLKEINQDAGSILTYVHEIQQLKSLTDAEIVEIHHKLEVSSFAEFMEKFTPSIYMKLDTSTMEVIFSQNHLGYGEEIIRLDQPDSIFSMLIHLIDAKQSKKYILTGFSDMLHNLIPKDYVDQIIQDRNRWIQHVLDAKFRNKRKIQQEFEAFCEKYDDGLLLLMGFIQDVEWNTTYTKKDRKKNRGITGDDQELQITVMNAMDRGLAAPFFDEETSFSYQSFVVQALENYAVKRPVKHQRVLQELLLLPVKLYEKDLYYLKERYELYSNFYIRLIKKFWIASKPLMETMIGIREFFEQYQDTKGMAPTMVIANFDAVELLQERHRQEFELYLQTVNDKNYHDNTVWYGIVPNITSEKLHREKVREIFQSNQDDFEYPHRNEIPETVLAVDILTKYQVITFMSFQVIMDNIFSGFAKHGSTWMDNAMLPFDKMEHKEYMVPCFPNFIVVAKEEASMNIGVELSYDEASEELLISNDRNVWFDEVGIEASYIAAGLIAACQCPNYLQKHFPKADVDDVPGVAYRFSQQDNRFKTDCNMISDSIEMSEEILQDVINHSKGVFFVQEDGKMTIMTDRTFAYSPNNQMLVSMIQTSLYIERVIRSETQDFKKNLIKQFFQMRPDSTIVKWKRPEREAINQILKSDEEIDYEIHEESGNCTLAIRFKDYNFVREKNVTLFKE